MLLQTEHITHKAQITIVRCCCEDFKHTQVLVFCDQIQQRFTAYAHHSTCTTSESTLRRSTHENNETRFQNPNALNELKTTVAFGSAACRPNTYSRGVLGHVLQQTDFADNYVCGASHCYPGMGGPNHSPVSLREIALA